MESTTITFAQRQAIIDNFQLEIAERARKLRSQYNQQAQALRARLEMRVNRIPQALRKRNIAELIEEHEIRSRPAPPPPMAMPVASERPQPLAAQPPVRSRQVQPAKRKSDEISTLSSEGAGKENEELPNPKKRVKATTTTVTANSKATRTLPAGRKAAVPGTTNPAGVLSPRSNNSRTLPHPPAPFKSSNLSPEKKTIPRTGAVSRAGNTSRAGARTATRPPAPASSENGRSSEASAGSNGTTIVKGKKAPAKKTTTTTTVASKAAAARKAAASTTAAVGRTLRKRN